MQEMSPELSLRDMLAAIEHIERKLEGISLNELSYGPGSAAHRRAVS